LPSTPQAWHPLPQIVPGILAARLGGSKNQDRIQSRPPLKVKGKGVGRNF
jgi:hypothetical protein